MTPFQAIVVLIAVCTVKAGLSHSDAYFGTKIGKFSTHFHNVKGDVYATDERNIFIRNFSYDGNGIDTFFWAGSSVRPDESGFIIPDEKGSLNSLKAYDDEEIVLRLPAGKRIEELRWLAVWSRRFKANFGSLIFPKTLEPPQPVIIHSLQDTKHGVSSGNILILDTQTFLVQDFSYDGTGKGAYWWLSRGMKPNAGGLQLYDENHSGSPLRKYNNETVVIAVPDGHTISEYETLSVWSTEDITDYGMVKLPKDMIVPPSARTLGLTPENKLNCEMLNDNLGFEARWVIEEDQLIMQLIGNLDQNEYMALGFSKDDAETRFTSADAVVAWISPDGQGHAVDYFFQSTEKCEDGYGMCPDNIHKGADDHIMLLNAAKVNDSITVTFKRHLKGVDEQFDQNIYTDGPQAVLWAVGPVSEDGKIGPPKSKTRGNLLLDFGREPMWNCPVPDEPTEITYEAIADVEVEKVHCPNDRTFRAQLGPPKNEDDYKRIWYINGLPHPDLTIQRGKSYTFIVEGGNSSPNQHPLYITSSKDGGLYEKILETSEDGEAVYAGVATDSITGALVPTAEGRLCEWTTTNKSPEYEISTSQKTVLPTLFLTCEAGNAGVLSWTPDANSSDYVYYQSFTEKNMGGRIKIVDFCEETNPNHYLQESQRRKDVREHMVHDGFHADSEREKEDDDDIDEIISEVDTSTKEYIDTEEQIKISEVNNISYGLPDIKENEANFLNEHFASHFGGMPSSVNAQAMNVKLIKDRVQYMPGGGGNKLKQFIKETITQSTLESPIAGRVSIASYPHDESERSDANILDLTNSGASKIPLQRPFPLKDLQKEIFHNNINRNTQVDQKTANLPQRFNVQFEGGFVPLVLNSEKEKETAIRPEFIHPPRHMRRPPRPFLFNESIPFHGTFKPGIPDFSGFNISHYTQDTTAHEPKLPDQIALLSAPKPQVLQKPASPINNLPHDIYRRPQAPLSRPQMLNFGLRPQMLHIPGHQQPPLFFQLTPKPRQPNFVRPPHDNIDLEEGSSQRVQITLQNPNDKHLLKDVVQGVSVKQPDKNKRPNGFIQPLPIIPPSPPIQRRPDIVDDEEVNYPQKTRPVPQINQHRKQPDDVPQVRPQPIRPQTPVRHRPFTQTPLNPNGRTKNVRPPLPAPPRILSESGAKLPLFIQRPGPHQQENTHDNPFVYRLPNRSTVHLPQQPPQHLANLMHHPRFPPHNLLNNGEKTEEKTAISNTDNGAITYEILQQMDGEKPIFFQQDMRLSQFDNMHKRPSHEIIYNRQPPRPKVSSLQHIRPHLSHERLQSDTPGQVSKLDKQQFNKQPLLNLQLLPEEHHKNTEKEISNSETKQLPESTAEITPKQPSENNQGIGEIISIKKEESQEIHLPPLRIPENFQDIGKPAENVNSFPINSGKQQLNPPELSEQTIDPQSMTKKTIIETEKSATLTHSASTIIEHVQNPQEKLPFGTRLKNRPTQETVQLKPVFQAPQKKHPHVKQSQPSTSTTEVIRTAAKRPENAPKDISNLYFNPGNSNSRNIPPKDYKIKELILSSQKAASEPEKISFSNHPGRKNILPSDSKISTSHINAPPKAPENIKLPEISEKLPSNDNGTDFSILSHVLSLISEPPKVKTVQRNSHIIDINA